MSQDSGHPYWAGEPTLSPGGVLAAIGLWLVLPIAAAVLAVVYL